MVTNSSFDANLMIDPMTVDQCIAEAKRYADNGQAFLAYDFAQSALLRFPDSVALKQISASALIRTGALDEAKAILEPLCMHAELDETSLRRLYQEFRSLTELTSVSMPGQPHSEALHSLGRVISELRGAAMQPVHSQGVTEETFGLLARVYKDVWVRTGSVEDGQRARDIYLRSFKTLGGYWTGVNAATMSWLLGEKELAETYAKEVLAKCLSLPASSDKSSQYWIEATIGEAYLLLGDEPRTIEAYEKAASLAGSRFGHIVSSLQQLMLLKSHNFAVPPDLFNILKAPSVVVFAGHMIDDKHRIAPRFPAHLENEVRSRIDDVLDQVDARIGYCCAAAGSDIIFIEAMQDRDAEVNIVLPFSLDDFIQTSVAFAGPKWEARFHRALKLADSIRYVTHEPLLGDTMLYDFAGKMFYGYGEIRARSVVAKPHLLTVWDGSLTGREGGTSEIIKSWPDDYQRTDIRVDQLLGPTEIKEPVSNNQMAAAEPKSEGEISFNHGKREIRAMLFADIVGYSKLKESDTLTFLNHFLGGVASKLKIVPEFANTWGDAIFAVMSSSIDLAEYALCLREIICNTNWESFGLPEQMSVRIGLHIGPVFTGMDPITKRTNYYGAHVNRAARIEPITIPGNIYATEQFAAYLMMQQSSTKSSSATHKSNAIVCDYIGTLSLAKNFASQAIYHVRRGEANPTSAPNAT